MLKKTIKYTNFNNEEVEEDFFFHLSSAELVELELSHDGGLSAALDRIVKADDRAAIIAEFKNIILKAYGVRSEDGRRFVKNDQLREEFASTEAYSQLFMELVSDADAAAAFVNGVVPKDQVDKAAAQLAGAGPSQEKRIVTPAELEAMEPAEFAQLKTEIKAGRAMIQSNKG